MPMSAVRTCPIALAVVFVVASAPAEAQLVVSDGKSTKVTVDYVRCQAGVRDKKKDYVTKRFRMRSSDHKAAKIAFEQYLKSRGVNVEGVNCGHSPWGNFDSYYADDSEGFTLLSWTGGFEASYADASGPRAQSSAPPGPGVKSSVPDHELKYQRELAEYRRQLSQREAKIKENEDRKRAQATQLQASRKRAEEALQAHKRQVAQANAAQRDYQQKLAEHQRAVKAQKPGSSNERRAPHPVEWKEAVSVCSLVRDNPQSKFGNWRCTGPLQFTYVKLGLDGSLFDSKARAQIALTCGGSAASVRDLGRTGGFRVFGCSFGLNPAGSNGLHVDSAKRFGLDYVPGRQTYRCPATATSCRTP